MFDLFPDSGAGPGGNSPEPDDDMPQLVADRPNVELCLAEAWSLYHLDGPAFGDLGQEVLAEFMQQIDPNYSGPPSQMTIILGCCGNELKIIWGREELEEVLMHARIFVLKVVTIPMVRNVYMYVHPLRLTSTAVGRIRGA
jgi:hypothetical protein